MASESGKKKVFDVAKPGKTAASPNARPTIIGHGPIMKDPMVAGSKATSDITDTDKPDADEDKPTAPTLNKETVIKPPEAKATKTGKPAAKNIAVKADDDSNEADDAQAPDEVADADEPEAKEEETERDETPEAAAEPEATEEKVTSKDDEDVADDNPAGSDSAAVSTLAANAEAQKKAEKEQKEAQAQQAALEKLVVEKKYFIPIGRAKRTRTNERALVVLILVIILALLAADLLVDAGIVRTSIKPPIQIFHNRQ